MPDSSNHDQFDKFVRIGKLGKPHGVTGEIRLYSMTDIPDRFKTLKDVGWEKDTKTKRLKVVAIRPVKRFFLMRFEDYDSPEKVGILSNGYLVISKEERAVLPKGRYYIDDIIGLKAIDNKGREYGTVVEVLQPGPHDIFEIKGPEGELLIPVVDDAIIEINIKAGYIKMKVPEYL